MKTFLQLARDLMKPGEEIAAIISAISGKDMEHTASISFISEAGFVSAVVKIVRDCE